MLWTRVRLQSTRRYSQVTPTSQINPSQPIITETPPIEDPSASEEQDLSNSTEDGTGFYKRMMNEMRQIQDLSVIPPKRNFESYQEIRESHFALRNYYDMRDLVLRLKFVLARLIEISMSSDGNILESLHHSLPKVSEKRTLSSRLRERYTNESLPPLPSGWSSASELEDYLARLVSKKYIGTSKKRPQLISTLILDLLRPNSPDTGHCLSTEAYNIAVRYFIEVNKLNLARSLLNDMMEHGGSIAPNTETFNTLLTPTRTRLLGGKQGYRRKYFNYYLRNTMIQENKFWKEKNKGKQVKSKKSLSDMLELFKPERDDIIYLQHPLQFVTSMLRAMADRNVPANAETWNIILNCAIGPVAKSAVLKYMDDYKIPLYVSGQESVLADLADFMGPQKVMDLITNDKSAYRLTKASIKTVVSRLVDVPTSSNISAAWRLINEYAASIDYTKRNQWYKRMYHQQTEEFFDEEVADEGEAQANGLIIPSPDLLNLFVEKFSKAGRMDLIIGVIAGFLHNWNVPATVRTWTFVLEALTRLSSTAYKRAFCTLVYNELLCLLNTRSVEGLPRNIRAWIRRIESQYEFHLQKLKASNTEVLDAEKLAQFENQLSSPFIIKNAEELAPERKMWEDAMVKLRWEEWPKLTFFDPEYIPKNDQTPIPTLEEAAEQSKKFRFVALGEYHPDQITVDNWATAARSSELRDLVISIGVMGPHIWLIQYFAKHEHMPNDTTYKYVDEWKIFYNNRKKEFRNAIDEKEQERRKDIIADPYRAYIQDLRKEFRMIEDEQ